MTLIDDLRRLPGMVSWFNPILLVKLLLNVIVADIFGQYADRRLIQAALDDETSVEKRQQASIIADVGLEDGSGEVWFDYVSDTGDGFDSTYAVAYLLAQPKLAVGGLDRPLPRGKALFMGGDEVYPTSTREDYSQRFRKPYSWALPNIPGSKHPPIFMIPGNHDWYDGLTTFLAMFCRKKRTSIGNWRTRQRRSYFAVELKENWWLWGIDIALTEDMDQPQADYFVEIAQAMPDNARIILCSAEPGWYVAESQKADAFRTLDYAAGIARDAKNAETKRDKEFKIVAVLSGDTHHYCRYESDFGTQFVTSGGGGAFLHGTHQLPASIKMDWVTRSWKSVLTLATTTGEDGQTAEACYPARSRSRKLLWWNTIFSFLNPGFALMLGVMYGVLGLYWLSSQLPGGTFVVGAVFYVGLAGYSYYMNKKGRALLTALFHAVAQTAALLFVLKGGVGVFEPIMGSYAASWAWWAIVLIWSVPLGGVIAGTLFGTGMLINCSLLDMDHNDAFGAMRLNSYRHFLRFCIRQDQLVMYAIGFDNTPKRDQWMENSKVTEACPSRIVPKVDLGQKLIDDPLAIDPGTVLSALKVSQRKSATLITAGPPVSQSTGT
ncbi:metallophosphoesterase [Bradyrhizobium liaoningense]|uniref:metallophosphoesterase n=1 Tax=Bradyrhizobium liaoningense TaxID=43992 RepID=UPI001BA82D99|nr:metallophosphoesterase [Bradyrhizobium liaoningense]MBR0739652.1 metallophosphoesterase [Bradyrhizobium liaoningense]